MNVVYYVEVNGICIAVLLLIWGRTRNKYGQLSTDKLVFFMLLAATILLCLTDMACGSLNGQMFRGAWSLNELSNLLYYVAISAISLFWSLYVRIKLHMLSDFSIKRLFLPLLPFLIFLAVAITNPFTHFFFTIDAQNCYHRGVGIYFHWFVTWLYFIVPTVRVAVALHRSKNPQQRREIAPLLGFIVAPAVASIIQMLYYGVTSAQAGITFSIVSFFLLDQDDQILSDAMTGLNNRRSFYHYMADWITHHSEAVLSVFLLDLNQFKQVNDRFGHMVGDRALIDAANILRQICASDKNRPFLCRYGGDEFLVCGGAYSPAQAKRLTEQIHAELERHNAISNAPYELSVSIGVASGACTNFPSAEALIKAADAAMYADKQRLRKNQEPE